MWFFRTIQSSSLVLKVGRTYFGKLRYFSETHCRPQEEDLPLFNLAILFLHINLRSSRLCLGFVRQLLLLLVYNLKRFQKIEKRFVGEKGPAMITD